MAAETGPTTGTVAETMEADNDISVVIQSKVQEIEIESLLAHSTFLRVVWIDWLYYINDWNKSEIPYLLK